MGNSVKNLTELHVGQYLPLSPSLSSQTFYYRRLTDWSSNVRVHATLCGREVKTSIRTRLVLMILRMEGRYIDKSHASKVK